MKREREWRREWQREGGRLCMCIRLHTSHMVAHPCPVPGPRLRPTLQRAWRQTPSPSPPLLRDRRMTNPGSLGMELSLAAAESAANAALAMTAAARRRTSSMGLKQRRMSGGGAASQRRKEAAQEAENLR